MHSFPIGYVGMDHLAQSLPTKGWNSGTWGTSEKSEKASSKTSKTKKKSKPADLFTKKVEEFKSLAVEKPDVIKFISENKLTIGAHISVANGIYNGLINAFKIRATAMAFFVTLPRRWTTEKGKHYSYSIGKEWSGRISPCDQWQWPYAYKIAEFFKKGAIFDIEQSYIAKILKISVLSDEDVSIFNEGLRILGYKRENIVPHGNYLVNLGSPDPVVYDKSYSCFVTELKLCEQLQIPWVNIIFSFVICF